MFNLRKRPYHLFLITAIIIFIVSLFALDYTLDIHLKDTYYVVSAAQCLWILASFLSLFWLLYRFTFRFMAFRFLTWLSILLTVVSVILLVIIIHSTTFNGSMPRRYQSWEGFELFSILNKTMFQSLALLTTGCLAYIVNCAIGIFKTSFKSDK